MKNFLSSAWKVFVVIAFMMWLRAVSYIVSWTILESDMASISLKQAETVAITGIFALLAGGAFAIVELFFTLGDEHRRKK